MSESTKSLPAVESIASLVRWHMGRPYIPASLAPFAGLPATTIRVAIPMSDEDNLAAWRAARVDESGRIDPELMPQTIWILSPHGHLVDVPTEEWAAAVRSDDDDVCEAIHARICPAGREECRCGAVVWMEI